MKLSRFGLGIAALVATVLTASAAGMFANLPIVSSAAYCALYAGDGTTCVGNVPAGPTALTGNEKIPADTQLSGGSSPQTVLIDINQLGAGGVQYQTPLTGASLTVLATESTMLLEPAGTIAALTVTLPAAAGLIDGQRWRISTTATVTALTLTAGSGTTVANTCSALTIATATPYGCEFMYKASNTKWYRVQ